MAFLWMCKVHQLRANFPSSAPPWRGEMGTVRDPAAPRSAGAPAPCPPPRCPAHPDKETHHVSLGLLSRGRATAAAAAAACCKQHLYLALVAGREGGAALRRELGTTLPPTSLLRPPRRAPAAQQRDVPKREGGVGGSHQVPRGAPRRPAAPPGGPRRPHSEPGVRVSPPGSRRPCAAAQRARGWSASGAGGAALPALGSHRGSPLAVEVSVHLPPAPPASPAPHQVQQLQAGVGCSVCRSQLLVLFGFFYCCFCFWVFWCVWGGVFWFLFFFSLRKLSSLCVLNPSWRQSSIWLAKPEGREVLQHLEHQQRNKRSKYCV